MNKNLIKPAVGSTVTYVDATGESCAGTVTRRSPFPRLTDTGSPVDINLPDGSRRAGVPHSFQPLPETWASVAAAPPPEN